MLRLSNKNNVWRQKVLKMEFGHFGRLEEIVCSPCFCSTADLLLKNTESIVPIVSFKSLVKSEGFCPG